MKLLYRTAEWHALAKLRMHTDISLALLESLTMEFGLLMQNFQDLTCSHFSTVELPREIAARKRRELRENNASTYSQQQHAILGHSSATSAEHIAAPAAASTVTSDRKCCLMIDPFAYVN